MGVSSGDIAGAVGVGDGLKETKNTAFVKAPATFCKWMDEGVKTGDVQRGTRYNQLYSFNSTYHFP